MGFAHDDKTPSLPGNAPVRTCTAHLLPVPCVVCAHRSKDDLVGKSNNIVAWDPLDLIAEAEEEDNCGNHPHFRGDCESCLFTVQLRLDSR